MTESGNGFDVTYNFATDTTPGKDPDSDSATLREYHRILWSKPLPTGNVFTLEVPRYRSHGYLTYTAPSGEKMWLSSDCITHSYARWSQPKALVQAKAELTSDQRQRYFGQAYTVGKAMIWPVKMGPPMTINRARGMKRSSIADRMDLTLECIRRYYSDRQESPLLENLAHNEEFFALFGGFREFVDFFHFQDLVCDDYDAVDFFLPCEDFGRPATPQTVEEYVTYREAQLTLVEQRQRRMSDWVSTRLT